MNRYRVMIGLLLAVAAVLLVLTLKPSKPAAGAKHPAEQEQKAPSDKRAARPAPAEKVSRSPLQKAKPAQRDEAPAAQQGELAAEPAMAAGAAGAQAASQTPRERAVAAWESLVDRVIAQADVPAAEQAKRVKEAFDALDKQDQMDGIRRSLNLFQDEQFPSLYDILFDKAEDPEVLDAIFSDALNRPEELKNPLMKELVKDKEHPCFFESARILDVIGELEAKPAPTASP